MKHTSKLFCALLLAVVVSLAGCGAKQDVQQSQAVADQFFKSLQSGRYQSAMQLFTARTATLRGNKAINAQKLQSFWQNLEKSHGKMQSWSATGFQTFTGGQTNPRHTVLTYQIQYSKGSGQAQITVQPEGNSYRITGFQFQ